LNESKYVIVYEGTSDVMSRWYWTTSVIPVYSKAWEVWNQCKFSLLFIILIYYIY